MSSRHTRKSPSIHAAPHSNSLDMIMKIALFASETHVTEASSRSMAEGVCDMINLFTLKELHEIQKKDKHFFELIHGLFYAIGNSNSKNSTIFKNVCHEKLGKEKNKLMNTSTGSHTGSKLLQDGGRFGTITVIVMIMWLLMSVDLIGNPGTAVTLSVMIKYLMTLSGVSGMNTFIQELFGKQKESEYPVAYAEGRTVKRLSPTDGASGKAYKRLHEMTNEVKKEIEETDEIVAENHVEALVGMASLVSCAAEGTCSEASDTVFGMALTPLAAADAARPKLTAKQLENNDKLKTLSKTLAIEQGKWFMSRDDKKIAKLQENITAVLTEINATNIQQGIVNSQPSLSNLGQITTVISKVGTNLATQGMLNGKVPNTLVLGSRENSSLTVHRPKAAVITSDALVAQGVKEFTVEIATIAKHHPGTEVDMASIQAFGKAYDLKLQAQQTVGISTTVDKSKILRLVERVFSGGKEPEGMMQIVGFSQVSKHSEARRVLTALVTEAAGNQALANGRRKQAVISAEVSKVLDRNIQETIRTTLQELTNQIIAKGFNGTRGEAEKAAEEAIEISRLFGVQPNLENTDYALTVINCSKGIICPKKPFSELRDRGELLREMSSWGFLERFQHAKWNMFISLIFMLPVGVIADVLLTTVVSLLGVGGCIGRCLTRGEEEKEEEAKLKITAAASRARRAEQLAEVEHEGQMRRARHLANQPLAQPVVGLIANAAPRAANIGLLANAPAPAAAAAAPAPLAAEPAAAAAASAAVAPVNQAAQAGQNLRAIATAKRQEAVTKRRRADELVASILGTRNHAEKSRIRPLVQPAKNAAAAAERNANLAESRALEHNARGGTRRRRRRN